ncbi:MAG: hypothetical protein WBQ14_10955 [Gaiellaceae bacterium]
MEAVDAGADGGSLLRQKLAQLVGERRLAGAVGPVYRESEQMWQTLFEKEGRETSE